MINLSFDELTLTAQVRNIRYYIGMSILDISKILMYKFWYDYINPKYGENAKLYY